MKNKRTTKILKKCKKLSSYINKRLINTGFTITHIDGDINIIELTHDNMISRTSISDECIYRMRTKKLIKFIIQELKKKFNFREWGW